MREGEVGGGGGEGYAAEVGGRTEDGGGRG